MNKAVVVNDKQVTGFRFLPLTFSTFKNIMELFIH